MHSWFWCKEKLKGNFSKVLSENCLCIIDVSRPLAAFHVSCILLLCSQNFICPCFPQRGSHGKEEGKMMKPATATSGGERGYWQINLHTFPCFNSCSFIACPSLGCSVSGQLNLPLFPANNLPHILRTDRKESILLSIR